MTEDAFIDGLFDREGRRYAEPPQIDQPTGPGGITLAMLALDRGRPCTVTDLRALTVAEAREVIRRRIRRALDSNGFRRIANEDLRVQLLDWAWNSGEARAVRWLQRTVGLPPAEVDGVIGPRTLVALGRMPAWLVNNALAGERARAAYHGGTAPAFAAGVARRALEFVLPLDVPDST